MFLFCLFSIDIFIATIVAFIVAPRPESFPEHTGDKRGLGSPGWLFVLAAISLDRWICQRSPDTNVFCRIFPYGTTANEIYVGNPNATVSEIF